MDEHDQDYFDDMDAEDRAKARMVADGEYLRPAPPPGEEE